jgi:murein DD-endopeptidase MepM/ murein hydrolase activator NlpD
MKVDPAVTLSIPGGIESLRGRKDPEAVRTVAREMEALFAYEMVKAMRGTAGGDADGKGFGGEVYGSMFDMELARVIASKGLGLQEILLKGFERMTPSGETAASPASTAATSVPAIPPTEPGGESQPAAVRPENSPDRTDASPPIREHGRVSSAFGFRRDPFTGAVKFHHGMDIAAPEGTPIHPVRGGKVVFSGQEKGYGNVVVVDHGDGFMTKYAHNRANLVSAGDIVGPDTVIAEVGSTGRSTGPHLHFEVSHEGKTVPPDTVLAGIPKGNR